MDYILLFLEILLYELLHMSLLQLPQLALKSLLQSHNKAPAPSVAVGALTVPYEDAPALRVTDIAAFIVLPT
ncbi:MAG: hypothetical protein ACI8XG_002299 [Congregibacter sp.]|jgi:hypothetical protein